MMMATTTYKIKNNPNHSIATHLVAGFIGQLKGLWDNALTEYQKFEILTTVKDVGTPYTQENVVHTLIYAITKHFIGEPTLLQENTSEKLANLRCRTLGEFKWYHDNYFSKVYSRTDVNQSY